MLKKPQIYKSSKYLKFEKNIRSIFALSLSILLIALPVEAASNPDIAPLQVPLPTSSGISPIRSDFNSLCSDVLKPSPVATSTPAPGDTASIDINALDKTIGSPLLTDCLAAQAARENQKKNQASNIVWAGVVITCGIACATPTVPADVCYGVGIAAIGVDIIEGGVGGLFSAFSGISGVLGPALLTGGSALKGLTGVTHGATTTVNGVTKTTKSHEKTPCLAAAAAAVQVFSKIQKDREFKKTEKSALDDALSLKSKAQDLAANDSKKNANGNPFTVDSTASPGANNRTIAGSNGEAAGASNSLNTSSICQAGAQGNSASVVSCALASDSKLPDSIKDPNFLSNVEKYAGKSLGDLAKEGKLLGSAELSNAIGGGAGGAGSTSGEAFSQLAKALKSAEDTVLSGPTRADPGSDHASASYAATGPTSGSGSSSSTEDPSTHLIAGLLAQMNGGGVSGTASSTVTARDVARIQSRSPSSLVEDKRVSLFDRVTLRYLEVSPRLGLDLGLPKTEVH